MEFESEKREMLGSVIEIKLPAGRADLFADCFGEISRIENEYSRFLDSSRLAAMNRSLGLWFDVPEEMIFLLEKAEEIKKKTLGNFDITLKSELDRLGYDKDYTFKEKPGGKSGLVSRIVEKTANSVFIDKKKGRAMIRKEIDFGGLGKGYCLDRVADILRKKNAGDFCINAGGDIYAQGESPWEILLEHPDDPKRVIGKIQLNGRSIACSAPNRRRWGKYHHLINAKTKMPQDSVKCIFVLASTGLEADAFATALFTAGFLDGIELAMKLPVEILAVSSENKMYRSPGFECEIFS